MKNLGIHLDKHPISVNVNGFIQIAGFSGNDPSSLCCFQVGECKHFADYGISEGSLLLASLNAAPQDNDLVVTKNEGGTGVRGLSSVSNITWVNFSPGKRARKSSTCSMTKTSSQSLLLP